MIRRTFRLLLKVLAGIGAGLAIVAIVLAVRLNAGPVSLGIIGTYIESALNSPGAPYRIAIGESVLIWAGWERNVDIRVLDARAILPDGTVLASVPELALSFSARALLRGVVAPRSIEVYRPHLSLARQADGRFSLGVSSLGVSGGDGGSVLERVAAILAASSPDPASPMSYLRRFSLVDASLDVADEAEGWQIEIPVPRLELSRTVGGMAATGEVLLPLEGATASLQIAAAYRPDEEPITVTVRFEDIDPGALGRAVAPLRALGAADFRASGSVSVMADADGALKLARVEVRTGEGSVAQPLEGAGRLAFQALAVQADLNAAGAWAGEAEIRFPGAGDQGRLSIAFTRQPQGARTDLAFDLADVVPAALAAATSAQASYLAPVAVPFSGTVTASLGADRLESIGFDLTGGAGHLLPPPAGQPPVPVKAAALRGRVEGPFERIVLDAASVDFADGAEFVAPGSREHRLPIRSLATQATYEAGPDRLTVDSLKIDAGGPKADIAFRVDAARSLPHIVGRGTLGDVPIGEARRLWPAGWGDNARDWVTAHMTDGAIRRAEATFDLAAKPGGGFVLNQIGGVMAIEGTTIDYLAPMPKARKVSGSARFDQFHFDIDIAGGEVEGLRTGQGKIIFSDLDKHDQQTVIDLLIEGPFSEAMALIDHKPLGFASLLGLTPAKTGGWVSTRLKLKFIAEKSLTIDQVAVSAHAELRDVMIEDAVRELDINGGDLALDVDKTGMNVSGRIRLGTMAGVLSWRENFTDKAPFRSRYEVQGQVDGRQRQNELGLDFPPFSGNVIDGPANASVRHTVSNDGRARMEADIDLAPASINLNPLAWTKAPGAAGKANVVLEMAKDRLAAVPAFTVTSADLSIAGSASFVPATGALERIRFDTMRFGRTNVTGALNRDAGGGWRANFSGPSFDMSTMLGDYLKNDSEGDSSYTGPPLDLSGRFETVWLATDRRLSGVDGHFVNDGERWSSIDLHGRLEEDKAFEVRLGPAGPARRQLKINSGDAGAALRGLDIYDNMSGGQLDISGEYDDSQANSPLAGHILVNDFRVVRAPVLVQLLSVMALTGVLDVLQGEGLIFNVLEAPFTMVDGVIHVTDGRAAGTSIGFTASGQVDTRKDTLNLEGTVVPAYAINSLLGRLPLVGGIFSGGEKGGGIFAANYAMTGDMEKPDIRVNPLSALAPGFLRRLFGIFDGVEPAPDDGVPRPERE